MGGISRRSGRIAGPAFRRCRQGSPRDTCARPWRYPCLTSSGRCLMPSVPGDGESRSRRCRPCSIPPPARRHRHPRTALECPASDESTHDDGVNAPLCPATVHWRCWQFPPSPTAEAPPECTCRGFAFAVRNQPWTDDRNASAVRCHLAHLRLRDSPRLLLDSH